MKAIGLTQGFIAMVDDEDYAWLSKFPWSILRGGQDIYARTNMPNGKYSRKTIQMHRLLLPQAEEIDHINGYGWDNRKKNLRGCSHLQNCQNRTKQRNATSQFKGVCWRKDCKKWAACITVMQTRLHLGLFDSEEEAARKYDEMARQHFGEFARLNFS